MLVTRGHRGAEEEEGEDARIIEAALPKALRPSEDLRLKVSLGIGTSFFSFLIENLWNFYTFIPVKDAALLLLSMALILQGYHDCMGGRRDKAIQLICEVQGAKIHVTISVKQKCSLPFPFR